MILKHSIYIRGENCTTFYKDYLDDVVRFLIHYITFGAKHLTREDCMRNIPYNDNICHILSQYESSNTSRRIIYRVHHLSIFSSFLALSVYTHWGSMQPFSFPIFPNPFLPYVLVDSSDVRFLTTLMCSPYTIGPWCWAKCWVIFIAACGPASPSSNLGYFNMLASTLIQAGLAMHVD